MYYYINVTFFNNEFFPVLIKPSNQYNTIKTNISQLNLIESDSLGDSRG